MYPLSGQRMVGVDSGQSGEKEGYIVKVNERYRSLNNQMRFNRVKKE